MFEKQKQNRKIKKYLKQNKIIWEQKGLHDSDICNIEHTALLMMCCDKLFKHQNREEIIMTVLKATENRLLTSGKQVRNSIYSFLDNEAFLNHSRALEFIYHICLTGETYVFNIFSNKKVELAFNQKDFEQLLEIIYTAQNPSGAYYVAINSAILNRKNALDFVKLAGETNTIDLQWGNSLLKNPFIANDDNLFEIFKLIIKQEDDYKKKMIYDVVTRNKMNNVISIISDYKSISKLRSANEVIFKTNDLEETKLKTFEYFKNYEEDGTILFSCLDLNEKVLKKGD